MPACRKLSAMRESAATIGFEAKLWSAADMPRNNMDAAQSRKSNKTASASRRRCRAASPNWRAISRNQTGSKPPSTKISKASAMHSEATQKETPDPVTAAKDGRGSSGVNAPKLRPRWRYVNAHLRLEICNRVLPIRCFYCNSSRDSPREKVHPIQQRIPNARQLERHAAAEAAERGAECG